ncbi:MAG: TIGR04255 family protein [Spirochaetia bacterium]|jgi:uncharacterized protein (TIGR04255 family)|nr:TIGR04255 family protein [Spirochaetia bacterium]
MKEIDTESIKYQNNFIKNVIFRVDFAPILSINDNLDSKFQESIRSLFPKLEVQASHQVSTKFENGKSTSKTDSFNQFVLKNDNNSKKLTISSQFIILEVMDFQGFEEFKSRVNIIITNFNDIYKPISIIRLGLRYINEIKIEEGSPFEWDGYINGDLISILNSELILKEETSRIMSQIIYKKEDFNLTFSYGLANSEHPNPISRKEYILDYDCTSTEADFERIIGNLEEYNKNMVILFENSIGDDLRSKLIGDGNG